MKCGTRMRGWKQLPSSVDYRNHINELKNNMRKPALIAAVTAALASCAAAQQQPASREQHYSENHVWAEQEQSYWNFVWEYHDGFMERLKLKRQLLYPGTFSEGAWLKFEAEMRRETKRFYAWEWAVASRQAGPYEGYLYGCEVVKWLKKSTAEDKAEVKRLSQLLD